MTIWEAKNLPLIYSEQLRPKPNSDVTRQIIKLIPIRRILKLAKKIRKTIAEFGNEMPENLPTPQESIKQPESRKKKELPAE